MSSPEPEPDVDAAHDTETGSEHDADAGSIDAVEPVAVAADGAVEPVTDGEETDAVDETDDTDDTDDTDETDETGGTDGGTDGVVPVRSRLSDLPTLTLPDQVEPVRRRRGRKKGRGTGVDADPSNDGDAPSPSLASPLLSGRSLEPTRKRRRFEVLRDHPRWLVGAAVVLLVVVGLVLGKMFAENAADAAMSERAAELEEMLADATPEEFLAFSSGVQESGSLAERTRDLDGFVNVKATAAQSFIRFQPSGWWSGFTERCLVAVVRDDGVSVTVPKTACIRVEEPAA